MSQNSINISTTDKAIYDEYCAFDKNTDKTMDDALYKKLQKAVKKATSKTFTTKNISDYMGFVQVGDTRYNITMAWVDVFLNNSVNNRTDVLENITNALCSKEDKEMEQAFHTVKDFLKLGTQKINNTTDKWRFNTEPKDVFIAMENAVEKNKDSNKNTSKNSKTITDVKKVTQEHMNLNTTQPSHNGIIVKCVQKVNDKNQSQPQQNPIQTQPNTGITVISITKEESQNQDKWEKFLRLYSRIKAQENKINNIDNASNIEDYKNLYSELRNIDVTKDEFLHPQLVEFCENRENNQIIVTLNIDKEDEEWFRKACIYAENAWVGDESTSKIISKQSMNEFNKLNTLEGKWKLFEKLKNHRQETEAAKNTRTKPTNEKKPSLRDKFTRFFKNIYEKKKKRTQEKNIENAKQENQAIKIVSYETNNTSPTNDHPIKIQIISDKDISETDKAIYDACSFYIDSNLDATYKKLKQAAEEATYQTFNSDKISTYLDTIGCKFLIIKAWVDGILNNDVNKRNDVLHKIANAFDDKTDDEMEQAFHTVKDFLELDTEKINDVTASWSKNTTTEDVFTAMENAVKESRKQTIRIDNLKNNEKIKITSIDNQNKWEKFLRLYLGIKAQENKINNIDNASNIEDYKKLYSELRNIDVTKYEFLHPSQLVEFCENRENNQISLTVKIDQEDEEWFRKACIYAEINRNKNKETLQDIYSTMKSGFNGIKNDTEKQWEMLMWCKENRQSIEANQDIWDSYNFSDYEQFQGVNEIYLQPEQPPVNETDKAIYDAWLSLYNSETNNFDTFNAAYQTLKKAAEEATYQTFTEKNISHCIAEDVNSIARYDIIMAWVDGILDHDVNDRHAVLHKITEVLQKTDTDMEQAFHTVKDFLKLDKYKINDVTASWTDVKITPYRFADMKNAVEKSKEQEIRTMEEKLKQDVENKINEIKNTQYIRIKTDSEMQRSIATIVPVEGLNSEEEEDQMQSVFKSLSIKKPEKDTQNQANPQNQANLKTEAEKILNAFKATLVYDSDKYYVDEILNSMREFKNSGNWNAFKTDVINKNKYKRIGFSQMIANNNFKKILVAKLTEKDENFELNDTTVARLKSLSARLQKAFGKAGFKTEESKFSFSLSGDDIDIFRTDMNSFRIAMLTEPKKSLSTEIVGKVQQNSG